MYRSGDNADNEQFKDLILCMGFFHMAKCLFGCLGKNLRGSGAENIWVENLVF